MLTITPEEFSRRIKRQSAALKKELSDDILRIVGIEAKNHFTENFQREGFDLPKTWQEVKRRTWGRSADSRHKILTGTGNLGRSIQKRTEPGKVIIFSDLVYAPIHNFGGTIHKHASSRLYTQNRTNGKYSQGTTWGRGSTVGAHDIIMPQRQFIGDSKILEDKLRRIIKKRIDSILK